MKAFAGEIAAGPAHYPQMLAALDFAFGPVDEILFAGDPKDPVLQAMLKEIYLRFLPNKIIMLHNPTTFRWWGKPGLKSSGLSSAYEAMDPIGGKLTAYVCRGRTCQLPVTDLESFKEKIK